MVISNNFKSFVAFFTVFLLGPVAFLRFIIFIKDCTSFGPVGVRKNVFSRGLSRKSEYFLSVCTILISIFLAIVVKNSSK